VPKDWMENVSEDRRTVFDGS